MKMLKYVIHLIMELFEFCVPEYCFMGSDGEPVDGNALDDVLWEEMENRRDKILSYVRQCPDVLIATPPSHGMLYLQDLARKAQISCEKTTIFRDITPLLLAFLLYHMSSYEFSLMIASCKVGDDITHSFNLLLADVTSRSMGKSIGETCELFSVFTASRSPVIGAAQCGIPWSYLNVDDSRDAHDEYYMMGRMWQEALRVDDERTTNLHTTILVKPDGTVAFRCAVHMPPRGSHAHDDAMCVKALQIVLTVWRPLSTASRWASGEIMECFSTDVFHQRPISMEYFYKDMNADKVAASITMLALCTLRDVPDLGRFFELIKGKAPDKEDMKQVEAAKLVRENVTSVLRKTIDISGNATKEVCIAAIDYIHPKHHMTLLEMASRQYCSIKHVPTDVWPSRSVRNEWLPEVVEFNQ